MDMQSITLVDIHEQLVLWQTGHISFEEWLTWMEGLASNIEKKEGDKNKTYPIRTNLRKDEAKRSSICDDIHENKISISEGVMI